LALSIQPLANNAGANLPDVTRKSFAIGCKNDVRELPTLQLRLRCLPAVE
jgi:hypothetical protein